MCGITGQFSFKIQPENTKGVLDNLIKMMRRRGPDDEGYWSDNKHCALGFRRLAILDLSPAGHQPMLTSDGRYAIVFNGEIYNFQEIRTQLEQKGIRFRSTGDTEVVLYALAEWGVRALEKFNGMFALAFYDTQGKRLLLARDHAGIKPLYYLRASQGIVFGSQYDQIISHPWSQNLNINYQALRMYLGLSYIPAPHAMFENTHNLQAGCWVEFDLHGNQREGIYYSFPQRSSALLKGAEAWEAVDAAVTGSVKRQLISDVPVGTFLSGGIDSPLITAKALQNSSSIKSFTLATEDEQLDESSDARIYAQQMGAQQFIETVTAEQAYQLLDDVTAACGEPFGDYSIIPTMLISRLAREHATVMLSGDGGDELFWGYSGRFASVLRKTTDFKYPHWVRSARWGAEKIFKLGMENYNPYYFENIGEWYRSKHTRIYDRFLTQAFPALPILSGNFNLFSFSGHDIDETAQWMRWNEFTGHLMMVLQKVDRASMYHSLEVRVPFLDREVINIALQLDWRACLDINNSLGKIPLRKSLARHVQHQTQNKRGFAVPMDAWLRGSLRPLFEETVLSQKEFLGLPFNAQSVRVWYEQHLSGKADYAWGLWSLLSLFLWEKHHVRNLRNLHPR